MIGLATTWAAEMLTKPKSVKVYDPETNGIPGKQIRNSVAFAICIVVNATAKKW